MSETIEGWTCGPYPEGARGAVRQDGRGILLYANGGFSGSDCYVPPAVLAWLIRPLLFAAWNDGNADGRMQRNPYLETDE